ncbi:ribonuclease H-like domain-containing protein [Tanacetum coccineum]
MATMAVEDNKCIPNKPSNLPQICNHFNKGSCKFGDRCKFIHDYRNRSGLNPKINGTFAQGRASASQSYHQTTPSSDPGNLYPVTKPSTSPTAFLSTSASTWHQRLGHLGDEVLRSLVSRQFISSNKEKSSHICHACQLGKHVKFPFYSSDSIVEHCFDIIHSDLWTSPIYTVLVKTGTWLLVLRPEGVYMVRSMWLFKHKFHADGSLSRYKARLVANGSSQQLGVDFDDTFNSVVKPATIRTGSQVAYLLLYVDDIILTASSTTLLQHLIDSLHREFDMTDLGALNYFLGIFVVCHSTESKLGPDGVLVLDPTLYRCLAGGLQYLTFTRLDLSYAVQQI